MYKGEPSIFDDVVRSGFSEEEESRFEVQAGKSARQLDQIEIPVGALTEAFHALCGHPAIGQDPDLLTKAIGELLPGMVDGLRIGDHIRIEEPSSIVYLWGARAIPSGASISGSFSGFLPGETYIFDEDMPPSPTGTFSSLYILLENAVIDSGQDERVELGCVEALINDGEEKILLITTHL